MYPATVASESVHCNIILLILAFRVIQDQSGHCGVGRGIGVLGFVELGIGVVGSRLGRAGSLQVHELLARIILAQILALELDEVSDFEIGMNAGTRHVSIATYTMEF